MEKIKDWLKDNGFGSGSGFGFGDGSGSGSGFGFGDGSGSGSGFGSSSGSGDGDGFGDGSGSGSGFGSSSGSGDGDGFGDGSGSGSGYGDGYGIKSINGKEVFLIDGIPTIISIIKGAFAKGHILNNDLTLTPCFVVKGHGYFAHGTTATKARDALQEKIFENMDADEAIDLFLKEFVHGEKYAGSKFFEWHHYLTGSCLMGRESFVKNHGLDLKKTYTVDEFIEVCENDYGGEIIKQLKERWNDLSIK